MKFKGKDNVVKQVQAKLGLKADGIDGPNTWKMIWENLVHAGKGEPEKPEPPVVDLKDDYPEVYDLVEMRRNELMGLDIVDGLEDKKENITKVGNVYTIDRWTKTKGDC